MKRFSMWMLMMLFFLPGLKASDWITISPITDRIIMLQFDDGYIDHYGYHQSASQSVSYLDPLDIVTASDPMNYTISSTNDPGFSAGIHPVDIGRKSRGHDFSRDAIFDTELQAYIGDIAYYHYIYLFLDQPISEGNTYIITLNDIAGNYNTDTLVFDAARTRSDLVHVTQVGFHPDAQEKYAYLSNWMGDKGPLSLDDYAGTKFHLNDLYTGEEVFEGTIEKRLDFETSTQYDMPQEATNKFISMTDVWECDFSSFNTPGEYVVSVENIGCSFPFEIGTNVYREAFYHTIRALYHHRSGIALEKQYTDWDRPRNLHPDDGVTKFQYTTASWFDYDGEENGNKADVLSKVVANSGITTWGWYMDAGDWDGYYSHTKIPRYLMTAWEMAPGKFTDGELNIPGSGNGIPDILDEARWLVDYLDRTRGPNGGVAGCRVHPDFYSSPSSKPSWEDERTWTIYAEDVQTTFTLAGLASHLSYCYNQLGESALADQYLDIAEDAYDWAITNMTDPNADVSNSWLYAAACLYKATGVAIFQNHFKTRWEKISSGPYASDNKQFATWAYITTDQATIDVTQKNTCINYAKSIADGNIVNTSEMRSFRVGFGLGDNISLGQTTTPKVFPALVAYYVTGDEKYLTASEVSCDFFLGGNPMNMLWMTGYGDQHPMQVLHLDTWYREDMNNEEMIPGIVPYGATNRDWMTSVGPWASTLGMITVYPATEQWPLHECYFDNRYAVPSNEYTVHQTIAPAAAVYGLMCDDAVAGWKPNKAPTTSITSISSTDDLVAGQDLVLKAEADDEDGAVIKVEYYNDWHKLGESDTPPYAVTWKNIPEGPYKLSVVAIDNDGKQGKYEQFGDNSVQSINGPGAAVLYPNPVRDQVTFRFNLPVMAETSITIYALDGKIVAEKYLGNMVPGEFEETLSLGDIEAGTYVSKIKAVAEKGTYTFSNTFIRQ